MSDHADPEVWLVRHGETEWSRDGKHTSTTDLPLTAVGEQAATSLAPRLADVEFDLVLTSPRQRARRTAELAGVADGHSLRVLTAGWLRQPAEYGRFFRLDTSTVSVLGFERETPVLLKWNS